MSCKIIGKNRHKNTKKLKLLAKKYNRKAVQLKGRLQGMAKKKEDYAQLLQQIKETLDGSMQKSIYWNKLLLACKDRVVKNGTTKERIDMIKNLDEKTDQLARALNIVLNFITKEQKTTEIDSTEISHLKQGITRFTTETLEELNRVSFESRITRYNNDIIPHKPIFIPSKKPAKALITTLFRLYRTDPNTDIQELVKKKKTERH